ncbi:MAG: HD domain-containing phosphohydrolase [Vulcanimicrobiota bacterium]
MTATATLPDFYERLSAARTLSQFQLETEKCAVEVGKVSEASYYVFSPDTSELKRLSETLDLDQSSLPAKCALLREECREGLALCVPVRHFGQLVGVLQVTSDQETPPELHDLLRVVGQIQEHVVGREESRIYAERSRDLMVQAVEALGSTPDHVKRVAQLCTELAKLLDLSVQLRYDLFQAAQYHDVGVLTLQGQSRDEAHRAHPTAGAEFLRTSRNLRHLAPFVEAHHERYDGSGFPHGLSGDQLPIDCWVMPLAEHLDEFWQRSLRDTYRDKLKDFFKSEADHHHPEVIDALCGLADSGRLEEILS